MKEIKGSTMKRRYARLPLALALGAMVLTPAVIGISAGSAAADTGVTLSGDARLVGSWQEDADFSDADDTDRRIEHRMRINVDAKAAGGTSLHTRFHMANNGYYTWDSATNNANRASGTSSLNVATDYLYVRVPVGPGTVIAGRQVFNFGHKLKVWDGRGDRLTYAMPINDELRAFVYYQKQQESQVGSGLGIAAEDEDQTWYGGGVGYKAGPLNTVWQVRHHTQEWSDGDDGQQIFGFVTYKLADLTLEFEGDFTVGDLFENAEDDNQQKFYLGAAYQLGDTTLNGGLAYAMAGSTANGHFDKISMFHNTSGGHRLGHTAFGASANPVDKAMAVGVGASHKLSPELTLGGRLAYTAYDLYNDNATGNDDPSVVSVDASMAYKINASTTYHIDAIYAKPDNVTNDDDPYFGLSHRLEIRF